MSECKGGSSGEGGGCVVWLLFFWFVYHGGCRLPEEMKRLREQVDRIESKIEIKSEDQSQ